MPSLRVASGIILGLILLCIHSRAAGQTPALSTTVALTVIDENSLPVPDAQVSISEPGRSPVQLQTNYAGRSTYALHQNESYEIRVEKPGFYQALESHADAHLKTVEVVLSHEQIVTQQVDVVASSPGIDPQQISNKSTMNTPEIVNIPYATSRDIRNLLPFNPGVIQDNSGRIHFAGSESYATLHLLDGFDIRSPVSGALAMRFSPDAIRTIDVETTRYPVRFGRATGGVASFYSGMGDNRFRFNATNFIPSFHQVNGIRFDKFVPRFTFSGPIVRDRAWFFDGLELEYDNIYIKELPEGANTNELIRGSNLLKAQVNLTAANILTGGLLVNGYHSPYDGISALVPQQSTTNRDITAWFPYIRDQHSFHHGAVLETGFAVVRFRDSYEPHGNSPFQLTPEIAKGSYFESQTSHSRREQAIATLYLPAKKLHGRHDLLAGVELNHITFDSKISRAPVNYLREDGTLLRQSTFLSITPFTRHNLETGAYLQDRWLAYPGLLIEPGLRFDWDEIIRRPLFSPRIALVYSPPGAEPSLKISAGIGLYYEHTQLEYLSRALAGVRYDTYYDTAGTTSVTPPLPTIFTTNNGSLTQTHALNWSIGVEKKLSHDVYASVNFLDKRINNGFVYANQGHPAALSGTFLLTNDRNDHYHSIEFSARHTFGRNYTLFASYTRSSARTNAALDYVPTVSVLGPQQGGPLPWDVPNRLISWGWLPFPLPRLRKSWDIVYALDWHSGFPFTPVNANRQVVGAAGSAKFPDYVSFSPGIEWKFHLRGAYFGLRGVIENATDNKNPYAVNNVVDSPQYGTFSQYLGRALTARIRLIGRVK
jgi:hypothetical protein